MPSGTRFSRKTQEWVRTGPTSTSSLQKARAPPLICGRDDGIVVVAGGRRKARDEMRRSRMPRALAERLGTDGTEALSAVLDAAHAEWSEEVLTLAAERFERNLSGEISRLRVDVARELAGLRVDVSKDLSDFRQDVSRQFAAIRQDISSVKVDLFKWSFLFWIGQVAAVAGLLAFMLRSS